MATDRSATLNTTGHWLDSAIEQLRTGAADTDTPALDAQLLVCHVLGVSRAYLLAFPETVLEPDVLLLLDSLLARRMNGEPIAYITGQREFWSSSLHVDAGVLVPRADTEVLVEKALELEQHAPEGYILDLGTGSGAIVVALAGELPQRQFLAVERSLAALRVAAGNVCRHACSNVQLLNGFWLDGIASCSVAMVLSNPPYLAADDPHLAQLKHEPVDALVSGNTGLEDIEHIVVESRRVGKPGAPLLVEHGHEQGASVRQLLRDNAYTGVTTSLDLAGLERISFGFVSEDD